MNWSGIKYFFQHLRNIENILESSYERLMFQKNVSKFKSSGAMTFCTGKRENHEIKCEPPWNILFFGTDEIAVATLKALNENRLTVSSVVNNLEVVSKVGKTTVRKYAEENGLAVHDWPIKIKLEKYDVAVLVSFGQLIPSSIIKSFPYGILNIHPSLLPRWRGSSPIIHTILNGDIETGVSIMKIMPKHFDVGPILVQKKMSVPVRSTSVSLSKILAVQGADMLINCLKHLPSFFQQEIKQDSSKATYAPKLTKAMAKIDWLNNTCKEIDQQYRAISAIIPLFTFWNGKPIKLLNMVDPVFTKDVKLEIFDNLPQGSIQFYKRNRILLVKCKDGFIGFEKIVHRRPLTALDFYGGFLCKSPDKYIVFDIDSYTQSGVYFG